MECNRASLRKDLEVRPEGSPGMAVRAALAVQEEGLAEAVDPEEAVVAVELEGVAVVDNLILLKAQPIILNS